MTLARSNSRLGILRQGILLLVIMMLALIAYSQFKAPQSNNRRMAIEKTAVTAKISSSEKLNKRTTANTQLDIENAASLQSKKFVINGQSLKRSGVSTHTENRFPYIENRTLETIEHDLMSATGYDAYAYLREFWRRAADLHAPQESMNVLRQLTYSDDEYLAKLASQALGDLRQLKNNLQGPAFDNDFNENSKIVVLDNPEKNLDVLESARESAYSLDYDERSAAIDQLNIIPVSDAQEILNQLLYSEFEPLLRQKAIRGIWVHAADGIGNADESMNALLHASFDEDASVAKLARAAIQDLYKLQRETTK